MANKAGQNRMFRMTIMTALAFAGGLGGLAAPARAGFEWQPPPAPVAPPAPAINPAPLGGQPGPAVRALPVAPVDMEGAPVLNDPLLPEMGAAPRPPQDGGIQPWPMASAAPVSAEPLAPPPSAVPPAPIEWNAPRVMAPAAAGPIPDGSYDVVEGFGSDIPLAIALQQIAPSRYAVSFGPGVNPGVPVSWTGGQPWNRVLESALAPAGLQASLAGNALLIHQGGTGLKTGMTHTSWASPGAPSYSAPLLPMDGAADGGPMPLNADSLPYRAIGMDATGYTPSYPRRTPGQPAANESKSGFDLKKLNPFRKSGAAATEAPQQDAGAPVSLQPASGAAAEKTLFPLGPATAAPREPDVRKGGLDPLEIRYWQAARGADLQTVLAQWSESAGVDMLWQAPRPYSLPSAVQLHGTYADAVTEILTAYAGRADAPTGQLYPNLPGGHAALVING